MHLQDTISRIVEIVRVYIRFWIPTYHHLQRVCQELQCENFGKIINLVFLCRLFPIFSPSMRFLVFGWHWAYLFYKRIKWKWNWKLGKNPAFKCLNVCTYYYFVQPSYENWWCDFHINLSQHSLNIASQVMTLFSNATEFHEHVCNKFIVHLKYMALCNDFPCNWNLIFLYQICKQANYYNLGRKEN